MQPRLTSIESHDQHEKNKRRKAWRGIYVDNRLAQQGDEEIKWTDKEAKEWEAERKQELEVLSQISGVHTHPVDFTKYPTKIFKLLPHEHLSIGDLHANPIMLIHVLIQYGVLDMKPEIYNELASIYYQHPTHDNPNFDSALIAYKPKIERFKELLKSENLHFTENAPTILIRIIGDELGDRGANDYFILLLIKALVENKIPIESLASNHSGEFFMACESLNLPDYDAYSQTDPDLKQANLVSGIDNFPKVWPRLGPTQGLSLENLGALIRLNLVDKQEIVELTKKYYMPIVKLLSYEIEPNRSEGMRFYMATHAPVGIKTVIAAATILGVPFDRDLAKSLLPNDPELDSLLPKEIKQSTQNFSDVKDSTKEKPFEMLAKIIEQINQKFEIMKQETLAALEGKPTLNGIYSTRAQFHKRLFRVGIEWEHHNLASPSFIDALLRFMWVRFDSDKHRHDLRPFTLGDAHWYFMHGHDGAASANDARNIINRNSVVGQPSVRKGDLGVMLSTGMSLSELQLLMDYKKSHPEVASYLGRVPIKETCVEVPKQQDTPKGSVLSDVKESPQIIQGTDSPEFVDVPLEDYQEPVTRPRSNTVVSNFPFFNKDQDPNQVPKEKGPDEIKDKKPNL